MRTKSSHCFGCESLGESGFETSLLTVAARRVFCCSVISLHQVGEGPVLQRERRGEGSRQPGRKRAACVYKFHATICSLVGDITAASPLLHLHIPLLLKGLFVLRCECTELFFERSCLLFGC